MTQHAYIIPSDHPRRKRCRTHEDSAREAKRICNSERRCKAPLPRRICLQGGGGSKQSFNLSRVFQSKRAQAQAPKPPPPAPLGSQYMRFFGEAVAAPQGSEYMSFFREAAPAVEMHDSMFVPANLYTAERRRNEELNQRYMKGAVDLALLQEAYASLAESKSSSVVHLDAQPVNRNVGTLALCCGKSSSTLSLVLRWLGPRHCRHGSGLENSAW